LVDDRTSQLQRSLEVQSLLYDKTRKHNEQLRQLNQLKDEFLSTMSHELRTPLTSMSLAIRMLRQSGITPERQAKYLEILEQQCDREVNLIDNLLKLQQLETNQAPLKLETIDLQVKLQALSDSFRQAWADKGLNIQLNIPKASLLAQTDEESFDRIVQELLTNAGKYSHPDTTVVLQVAHQVDLQLNQVVLQLTNTGAGISEEDRKYIFEKFRRGQGVTQQAIQGTGLGLALVKCLVQHLNGTIEVTSNSIEDSTTYETCFTVTLPQSFSR
jgi:signal transduction histidine kinase